jgi:hypothetical protein
MITIALALLFAQDPAPDSARLIEQLESDDLEARDAAEAALVKAGRAALPAVRKALGAAKGEAKSRLERVVKAVTEPRWMTDADKALAAAKGSGKPLLIFSTGGSLKGYL